MRIDFRFSVLALLAGGLVVLAWQRFAAMPETPSFEESRSDAACDLHRQSCGVVFAHGGRLDLTLTPRPLRALQPFIAEVRVAGLATRSATLSLTGIGMDMGLNRVVLPSAGDGVYRGQAMLSVCTGEPMDWLVNVDLHTDQGDYRGVFRLPAPEREKQ